MTTDDYTTISLIARPVTLLAQPNRHIQLPQDCVAENVPDQLFSKRAIYVEFARGSWGQLQWMFGGDLLRTSSSLPQKFQQLGSILRNVYIPSNTVP